MSEWLRCAREGLTDRQVVERIALDICHRLNQATPVSAMAAVSVAMLGAPPAATSTKCAPPSHRWRGISSSGVGRLPGVPTSPTVPRCRRRCTTWSALVC